MNPFWSSGIVIKFNLILGTILLELPFASSRETAVLNHIHPLMIFFGKLASAQPLLYRCKLGVSSLSQNLGVWLSDLLNLSLWILSTRTSRERYPLSSNLLKICQVASISAASLIGIHMIKKKTAWRQSYAKFMQVSAFTVIEDIIYNSSTGSYVQILPVPFLWDWREISTFTLALVLFHHQSQTLQPLRL